MTLSKTIHASPIGDLNVIFKDETLYGLDFEDNETRLFGLMARYWKATNITNAPLPARLSHALDQYFNGDDNAFRTVKTHLNGTAFQEKVWHTIRNIPWGQTVSYGALAKDIEHPNAQRAVGAANGANPIAIIHACHRVVGADGTLTGFAGGLDKKEWLLGHERTHICQSNAA